MTSNAASYVYGIVRNERPPSAAGAPPGLPGTGRVRLLPAGARLWLIVADAPLSRYGEDAIEKGLRDLDWVSRGAIAHEQVLRHFAKRWTTVPMRLFTLFRGDDRAKAHVDAKAKTLARVFSRIEGCDEWGVRVVAVPAPVPSPKASAASSTSAGRRFLEQKRAERQSARRVAAGAPRAAAGILRKIARLARAHRRLPIVTAGGGTPLLLDAAFLVPRKERRAFRAAVARVAAGSQKQGVLVTPSGPWPPYNFVDDSR
jgi:hypothetical protein